MRTAYAVICTVVLLLAASWAGARDLPLLADELAEAAAAGGAPALRQRFEEIWPDHKDDYDLDMEPMTTLMIEAMQAGDMALVDALGEVNEVLVQDAMEQAMASMPPELQEQIEAAERERKQAADESARGADAEESHAAERRGPQRGEPRDDLARFEGLYGDPAQPDSPRKLFVTRSCDGYLVVGAMWGDVAPWWMRSDGDLRFSYADSFTAINLTFLPGEDGTARGFEHDIDGLAQPLVWQAPLPDMFERCMQPPLR